MTKEQAKKRIEVMQAYTDAGWRIEIKLPNSINWDVVINPEFSNPQAKYRAVRVDTTAGNRVPMPWETLSCGMVVRFLGDITRRVLVLETSITSAYLGRGVYVEHHTFTRLEYLDGNEWKPLWTEGTGIERIVETISEE